jgi:hypothetical protein
VTGLSIGQNFAMDLGSGLNTTSVVNSQYLGSYSEIDTGNDHVTFTGNRGFGNVTISARSLVVDDDKFIGNQISGAARFTSTVASDNTVKIGQAVGAAITEANRVVIGKSLVIDLNPNTPASVHVAVNNVKIQTNLSIAFAASAAVDCTVTNTTLGGDLGVNVGASTAAVTLFVGASATANTGDVNVAGNLTITSGGAGDRINVCDAWIGGATTITTNAGNDQVNLETLNSNATPSQFFGAVNIFTGNDDDQIGLGQAGTSAARFYGAVLFDGGTGTNILNETVVFYYGGQPTRKSFIAGNG